MSRPLTFLAMLSLVWCVETARDSAAASPETKAVQSEYLSEHPERILHSEQSWGELGIDTAAHQKGMAGTTLAIGDRTYDKGLGHHANGSITVLLEGEFSSFDVDVGLQPCGAGGSVIFRVFADGRLLFDSGVISATNLPVPVHLELNDANELHLEVNDAGDGLTCDMANWASARLTRRTGTAAAQTRPNVDIAPFGRIVAWDPNRADGARANRIEEFLAEDIYLETPLAPGTDRNYRPPLAANGLTCIGLQWLNRRALARLELSFAHAEDMPLPATVEVQAWFGESAWQGQWKALNGTLDTLDSGFSFRISPKNGVLMTRKVRWVFPCPAQAAIRSLSAYTRSAWETVELRVDADKAIKPGRTQIRIVNGELLRAGARQNQTKIDKPRSIKWNGADALQLTLLSSRASSLKSDPTLLQFETTKGTFAVAIDDVLNFSRVFLPEFGISVAHHSVTESLPEYKDRIAGRKTVLEQVRMLPDQSFEKAMDQTHHMAQCEGPVLLSLACDNLKFVLERDGTLRFPSSVEPTTDWYAAAGEIHPGFGAGTSPRPRRELDGGWLPVPVITIDDGGVVYRQRTFVVPVDGRIGYPKRMDQPAMCVIEFTVTNTLAVSADASLRLTWLLNTRDKPPLQPSSPGTPFPLGEAGLKCMMLLEPSGMLNLKADQGLSVISGKLPPGASLTLALLLSNGYLDPSTQISGMPHWREQVECYWEAALQSATQIRTPDPMLNNLIRSSQVRCLIAARNEAGGSRIAPWIAAMSYGPLESEAHSVIRGMDFMGHAEFARRGLDFFIHRYNTNGFLTTGYTTFGTAWHLWTLGEHYQLCRDTNWLRQITPEVERVGRWILQQIDKTTSRNKVNKQVMNPASVREDGLPPEYGLMPPGVLADWNAFAYHYAMNAYYYAALHELGTVLPELTGHVGGRPDSSLRRETQRFNRAAERLRGNLLRAYRWTQSQSAALPLRNGTWVRHYPSQVHSPGKLADFFPGQDAGRSWCYDVELGAHQLVPAGVLEPNEAETTRILEHMEDVQFLADGWFDYPAAMNEANWFDLGGFSKVQPYYTRNCEIYALRDEVKPFIRSYYNSIAALLNPEVLTFWEHFNHSGAWDKTHETGYFLHQTRTMLVTERGQELWLAPLVTSNWFGNGMVLSVSNAPTRFGPVTYTVRSSLAENRIETTLLPPDRRKPRWIVLRLRHPEARSIRRAILNGRSPQKFHPNQGLVWLKPIAGRMSLEVLY